jgi:DNA repair exonuclease SbcCD ATPase subunit
MIPHRIQLSGFLSYKGEQTVRFADAPVWMLAGTNGSGKSSVFDAVTYALFGSHRGGTQAAAELINKDSASLCVEFDFRHDSRLYRARRTLKRTKTGTSGTQQLLRQTDDANWEPIPDTNLKAGFDRWVRDAIGLTYDTFTSSVLLLQGRAEKLLDASPKGRAEVLAGIVDLERYQKLHERANDRKLKHKGELDALGHQAAAVPEVGELEYAAAEAKVEGCEAGREQAAGGVDTALRREQAAARWADLQNRSAAAAAKLAKATGLLGEAVRIERQFHRLRELREVLPAVFTVVGKRAELVQSEVRSKKLQEDRLGQEDRRRQAEAAREQARQKRDAHRKQVEGDEAKRTRGAGRLQDLSGQLEAAKLIEDQQAELDRLSADLKKLPADPEAAVRVAHDAVERLTELNRVLPILERVQTERHDLREALRTEAAAAAERDAAKAAGLTAKAAHDQLVAERDAARAALSAAEQRLAVTRALADQAAAAAAEFATLSGQKDCRACGQPLTPQHFAAEKAKRESEAKQAAAAHAAAKTDRERAAAQTEALTAREAELVAELGRLREQFKDHAHAAKTAQAEGQRLAASLRLRYAELPADSQRRIAPAEPADWTRTTYPERDELVALRREAEGLDAAKRSLKAATDTATKAAGLRSRMDQARQALDRLAPRLAGDPVALRKEHADLKAADAALANAIKAGKLAAEEADRAEDQHGRESHVAAQRAGDLAGQLRTEDEKRKLHAEAADRALAQLPESWKSAVAGAALADYQRWSGEQAELVAAGVEAAYAGLEQARGQLAGLRQDAADAQAAADAVPADDRTTPDAARASTQAAKQALAEADKALRDAQRHKATLDGYRQQRAALGEQVKAADAAFTRYKTLSELLGRDRLQRHLVRTAERQIVDYANAVLDRLSGGQLFLRLAAGDDGAGADRALELECVNRVAGGSPILVAFLSGSQRFRVAVALALGIGQYASKQHRPIESVIIDEGFGCLDRAGRQVMIQELQNLRGHLHCILLVSHQEEFADAFPDGYRFALKDGATEVTRFER